MFSGVNENQYVAEYFVAAFLQAGIPPAKLQHPSIQGLLRKYTKVAPCVPEHHGVYIVARRVGDIHLGAVRKIACGKKLWIGTDEWTDDQGHTIIDVLLGVHGRIAVFATVQLQCKGPNLGVEHSELGTLLLPKARESGLKTKIDQI